MKTIKVEATIPEDISKEEVIEVTREIPEKIRMFMSVDQLDIMTIPKICTKTIVKEDYPNKETRMNFNNIRLEVGLIMTEKLRAEGEDIPSDITLRNHIINKKKIVDLREEEVITEEAVLFPEDTMRMLMQMISEKAHEKIEVINQEELGGDNHLVMDKDIHTHAAQTIVVHNREDIMMIQEIIIKKIEELSGEEDNLGGK
jgi:hypothetical protein